MKRDENTQCRQPGSKQYGDAFPAVVMMILTALKQDGGGYMHENSDHHGEQLRGVAFQKGEVPNESANRGHEREHGQQSIGAFLCATVVH